MSHSPQTDNNNWYSLLQETDSCASTLPGKSHSPYGLVLHLPFCHAACQHDHCSAARQTQRDSYDYLSALKQEVALRSAEDRYSGLISHVLWRGDALSYLDAPELVELCHVINQGFAIKGDVERVVEFNAATCRPQHLDLFRALGFNRLDFLIEPKLFDNDRAQGEFLDTLIAAGTSESLPPQSHVMYIGINLNLGSGSLSPEQLERQISFLEEVSPDVIQLLGPVEEQFCQPYHLPNWQACINDQVGFVHQTLSQQGYQGVTPTILIRRESPVFERARQGELGITPSGLNLGGAFQQLGLGRGALSLNPHEWQRNVAEIEDYIDRLLLGGLALEHSGRVNSQAWQQMLEEVKLHLL